jgi:hypothetical protein
MSAQIAKEIAPRIGVGEVLASGLHVALDGRLPEQVGINAD